MAKKSERQPVTRQRKKWQKILQINDAETESGQNKSPTVVIDTNVWYSALLYGGNAEAVVRHCLKYTNLVISSEILEELVWQLKHKVAAPYKWIRFVRIHLEKRCKIVDLNTTEDHTVRDPKDEHVVAAALASRSEYIITGDKDLLELKQIDQVMIINAAGFLQLSEL